MILEDLLQGSKTLAYIVNRSVDLDAQTEISALRSSNERLEKQLEAAIQKDPERYAPIIRRYQAGIDNNLNRIMGLESGSGGDGKPPKRPSGVPARDEYQKEKADLVKYFSKDAIGSVLKTDQDMTYVAIGVRTLSEMGIKLEDYEPGLPKDYKLEVLRRSGQFEEVFKADNRFVRYIHPQGQSMYRVVSIEDFKQVGFSKNRYLGLGLKSFKDFFEKGVPCEDYDNRDYKSYWAHVANKKSDLTGERGTESAFVSVTETEGDAKFLMDEFGYNEEEAYIIEFRPRGLHYIDAEKTLGEDSPLTGMAMVMEKEKSVIGYIDLRDIISISVYGGNKLIRKEMNKGFIKG